MSSFSSLCARSCSHKIRFSKSTNLHLKLNLFACGHNYGIIGPGGPGMGDKDFPQVRQTRNAMQRCNAERWLWKASPEQIMRVHQRGGGDQSCRGGCAEGLARRGSDPHFALDVCLPEPGKTTSVQRFDAGRVTTSGSPLRI